MTKKVLTLTLIFAALFVLVSLPCQAEESIAWGMPVNGLRLGLSAASGKDEPALLATFENLSSQRQDLLIGAVTGHGPTNNMELFATAPDGRRIELPNLSGANGYPEGGLVTPLWVNLQPGERHELRLEINKIIYVENRQDIPLDRLLAHGYSVTVSLNFMKGMLVSGTFLAAPPR